eukprot:Sspe_Gene.105630::Locus_82681_Transcript_1_1_Confidence_1.000_Length_1774::g.105630::m.105630
MSGERENVLETNRLLLKILKGRKLIGCDRSGLSDPYVVARFQKQEQKTKVKHQTVNPEWNETLHFRTHADVGQLVLEVYDKDITMTSTFMGCAVFDVKEGKEEKMVKLRPKKASDKRDYGELHISYTFSHTGVNEVADLEYGQKATANEVRITEFRLNLERITKQASLVLVPYHWVRELLLWKQPYQTLFFLCALTWTCYTVQFDIMLAVSVAVIMSYTHFLHCRFGPDTNVTTDVIHDRYPDLFRFMGQKKNQDLRLHAAQVWTGEIADRLDAIWDVVTFKDTETANFIVKALLTWMSLELLGLCLPPNLLVLTAILGCFIFYPLHHYFPNIASHYNLLTFLFDDGCRNLREAKDSTVTRRITYRPARVTSADKRHSAPCPNSVTPRIALMNNPHCVPAWVNEQSSALLKPVHSKRKAAVNHSFGESTASSVLSESVHGVEWNVTSVAIPSFEERGNTTYFAVEVETSSGTFQVWRRYTRFRQLLSQLTAADPRQSPAPFPGKTLGKCKDVDSRRRELETFLVEMVRKATGNPNLRPPFVTFLELRKH